MFADKKLIQWLIDNRTPYFIHQNSGISQSNINDIKRGKREIDNLSLKVASKLTNLAIKEKNTASNE